MQIYRSGTKPIMVMSVDQAFSFDRKKRRDHDNPKVIAWERLVERFQRVDDDEDSNGKWRVFATVFNLTEHS